MCSLRVFIVASLTGLGVLAASCGGGGTTTEGSDNNAPVVEDVSRATELDQTIAITLVGTDADGDTLTFSIVELPSIGSLNGAPPNLTYTPPLGLEGVDEFSYRANDGVDDSNLGTYTITITDDNTEPTADDQAVSTDENVAVDITLTGSDAEDDELTFVVVDPPDHGTLTGTPPEVTYTPQTDFNGVDTFLFRVNDGTFDSAPATVTVTVTGDNDPPTGNDDEYTTICNTLLEVGIDVSTRPKVEVAGSVLDNDDDPELGSLTVTGTTGVNPGASLTMNADGTFSYLPPVVLTGSDTFEYTVSDGVQSSSATVTIVLGGPCIWFIDNSVTGGDDDGRSESPFESLADFGASLDPQAGHAVYIHTGSAPYNGPLSPKDSMVVAGAGVPVNFSPLSIPVGVAPVITDNGAANALNIASNNTFTGLDLEASISAAVAGSNKGGITIFSGVNVTASGTGKAIAISGQTGSFSFANSGTISSTSATTGISVINSSGTIVFGTPVNLSTATGSAIVLTNNDGGTVRFSGGLDIDTTSGEGLSVTAGGTVEVTGAGNTIDTTTGRALRVEDTDIGAAGLTFASISSDGAVNGIWLENTGTGGGLTVTGDGSNTNNASGGTIESSTGDAVLLVNTQDVSLTSMAITSPVREGIDARNLRGTNLFRAGTISGVTGGQEIILVDNNSTDLDLLEINNSLLLGVDGAGDDGLWLRGYGASSMRVDVVNETHFNGIRDYAIYVASQDSSDLVVNIENARFSNDAALGTGDSRLFFYTSGAANLRTNVADNVFTGLMDGLTYDINGTGAFVGRFLRNDVDGITAGRALFFRSEQATASVDLIIDDNDIDDVNGDAIAIELYDTTTVGNISITDNRIGTVLPVNGHGVRTTVRSDRVGSYGDVPIVGNLLIDNNTIINTHLSSETLDLDAQVDHPNGSTSDPAATLNATVTNNLITNVNNLGGEEVEVDSEYGPEIGQPAGPSRICLDMRSNSLESGAGIIDDFNEDAGTLLSAILDVVQASIINFASDNGILVGNIDEHGTPNYGAVASCPLPTHAP